MSYLNEIAGKTTRPYCGMYPTDSIIHETNDYAKIEFDLNQNDVTLVIDFGEGATGATVAFSIHDLRLFIAILQTGLRELEELPPPDEEEDAED